MENCWLVVGTFMLILSSQSRLRGKVLSDVLQDLINTVPVPVEESWSES